MIVFLIILVVILAALAVWMYFQLSKMTREKALLEKQEKRSWMLKIALEKSCELPAVEPDELEKIEPQLDQLMSGAQTDGDTEEKIRQLIMSLYKEKTKGRGAKEAPKKDANPPSPPPITGRQR
jgi:hypothetical protein